MMPKPTDRLKKICPNALTHTEVSPSADHFGSKSASSPVAAPGRVRATTTRVTKATTSTGTKITAVRPIPPCTPAASTARAITHRTTIGTSTPGTISKVGPGSSAARRKSPKKNASGSDPHARLAAKPV